MITVVAALIQKGNRVLIAKRSTGDSHVLGKWEFPGGKVKDGESEFVAIEREIREEFELSVRARSFLTNNIFEYPNKIVDLRLYSCEYIGGEFNLHDHSEYKWILIDDILDYDLAPADINLAIWIRDMYE